MYSTVFLFQLSRIVLDSKSPLWQKADLRSTRLKDPERGELLIFKEVSSAGCIFTYQFLFWLLFVNENYSAQRVMIQDYHYCSPRGQKFNVVIHDL